MGGINARLARLEAKVMDGSNDSTTAAPQQQPPAQPPREAAWEPVDVQVVDTPRGRYKIEQRFQPKPVPRERPRPLPVQVPEGGDVEVESLAAAPQWCTETRGVRVKARAGAVGEPRMVSLRRASAGTVVVVLLALWVGYAWGSSVGRAEMAREIIRAGVHRLADRPALVDTIEDASGWDADTREAERQRGRDERGR